MGALVDKYRPKHFNEVVGHDKIIKALKRIIDNPSKYPKNLLFSGSWGVGKTSVARIFYSELAKKYDARLYEFDVTLIGNIESMKDIRDLISSVFAFGSIYRVVIFDEMQDASKRSQDLLLKCLEDHSDANVFYIFTTTDIDKIIDTLRSRCTLVFNFSLLSNDEIKNHLQFIAKAEGKNDYVNSDVLDYIVRKSKGHLRDAINLLDFYFINSDEFFELTKDASKLLYDYIFNNYDALNVIVTYPVSMLKENLSSVILEYVNLNVSSNFIFVTNLLELYMKYKNYITTLEDFIAVISILKKYVSNTKNTHRRYNE